MNMIMLDSFGFIDKSDLDKCNKYNPWTILKLCVSDNGKSIIYYNKEGVRVSYSSIRTLV